MVVLIFLPQGESTLGLRKVRRSGEVVIWAGEAEESLTPVWWALLLNSVEHCVYMTLGSTSFLSVDFWDLRQDS